MKAGRLCLESRRRACAETDLNPVAVVGLFGKVGAACVTGRDVLSSVRAADGIECAAEAGAVGGAQRSGRMEDKCGNATESTVAYRSAPGATAGGRGFGSPPSGSTQASQQ